MIKIVSLIPARGGSKGIPGKNMKIINGKRLIHYAIDASIRAGVDETWVSTDNQDIERVSQFWGAKVIQRPEEISGDDSSTEESIFHFMEHVDFDVLVLIQCTSPMIKPDHLIKGLEIFKQGQYDSLFSAVKSNDLLIWNQDLKPINYDINKRGNRQGRKEYIYVETGSFYISSRQNLEENKCRLGGKIGIVEIPFWESFEIDTLEDYKHIKKLME
jgi:N-acylneuraminate cytidylyltransferase